MSRTALSILIVCIPWLVPYAAADSQGRVQSEAQERFERAQGQSDLQDMKATLARQRAAIRSQRNDENVSSGERARKERALRQSQRSLRRQQQASQNLRTSPDR